MRPLWGVTSGHCSLKYEKCQFCVVCDEKCHCQFIVLVSVITQNDVRYRFATVGLAQCLDGKIKTRGTLYETTYGVGLNRLMIRLATT